MVKINTCVLISGYGSNLKSLINKSREYNFPAKIKLVISNNLEAKGIYHARKNSIPFYIINTKNRNYDHEMLKQIKRYNISLICLAGYMKIIPERFISQYKKRLLIYIPLFFQSIKV